MRRAAPLGVYDSGLGGLTVLRSLKRQVPGERVVYYGDTAHVPYGGRSAEEIVRFSQSIIHFLVDQGAKLIVAACNTSSALALPHLASPVPVLGMIEPAVGQTLAATRNGRVGLLATEGTVRSGAYETMLRRRDKRVTLISQPCPRLVPLIESGHTKGSLVMAEIEECIAPLRAAKVDTIILGCTHYPLVEELIRDRSGPGIELVDPAQAVVESVQGMLAREGGLSGDEGQQTSVYVSGDPRAFAEGAAALGFSLESVRRLDVHD